MDGKTSMFYTLLARSIPIVSGLRSSPARKTPYHVDLMQSYETGRLNYVSGDAKLSTRNLLLGSSPHFLPANHFEQASTEHDGTWHIMRWGNANRHNYRRLADSEFFFPPKTAAGKML